MGIGNISLFWHTRIMQGKLKNLNFCLVVVFLLMAGCARPVLEDSSGKDDVKDFSSETSCTVVDVVSAKLVCVRLIMEDRLIEKKFSSFRFYFTDSEGFVLLSTIPNIQIELWMPSMGHGSVPTKVQYLDGGIYLASNVYFIMKGEWEMRFKWPSEVTGQHVLPLPVRIL